jgi:methylaspartate mutase sigma subunit
VLLQLLLEELGQVVVNLGACVPDELLVATCRMHSPALVVLTSVNGHGRFDGKRVIGTLRRCRELADTRIVLGGKLTTGAGPVGWQGELVSDGFDAVYDGGDAEQDDLTAVREFLARWLAAASLMPGRCSPALGANP